jgi:enterochelin esterase family protein
MPESQVRSVRIEAGGCLALLLLLRTADAAGQVSESVVPVPPGPWAAAEIGRLGGGAPEPAELDRFWRSVEAIGTPIIERDPADARSMLATFVARAPGGPLNAVPAVHGTYGWHGLFPLANVTGSDIWLATIRFPSATRSAYWLAWPRGRNAHPEALDVFTVMADKAQPAQEVFTDPFAPRVAPFFSISTGKTGRYSWFEGPDAPPQPWLLLPHASVRGALESRLATSAILGNTRELTVYLPPGYASQGPGDYPLLLMFDRDEYLTTVRVPQILDAMIGAGAVPPLIAVLVDVIDHDTRNRELPGDPRFQQFIREELLPQLEGEFRVTRDPAKRIAAGVSYGGLSAMLLAMRYPEAIGAVLSQSGAFWRGSASAAAGGGDEVAELVAGSPRLPLRFSLTVGLLEGERMLGANRRLRDALVAKGHEVDYAEFMGAHDWIAWRAEFPRQLIALFADPPRH